MATYVSQIHSALTSAALAGVFPPVSYSGRDMTVDEESSVVPSSALAFEIASSFGLPIRQRRDRMQERLNWEWLLVVEFNTTVTFERFEEDLCASQILIPRTDSLRQITLRLVGAEYEHPARQQAAKGSTASFRFEAILSPA